MAPILIALLFGFPLIFLGAWASWVLIRLANWGSLRRSLHWPHGATTPGSRP